jgi:hypothetical protein
LIILLIVVIQSALSDSLSADNKYGPLEDIFISKVYL